MSDEHPRYSPDGRDIALSRVRHRRARSTTRATCACSSGAAAASRRLAPRLDRATQHHRVGARLAARCSSSLEDRGRVGLWRLPRSTPRCAARWSPGGTIGGFAQSADGARARLRARIGDASAGAVRRRGDGSGERAIETLNRALLARHALGEVREVTVKGWGGEPVQMLVTYPPNFDPAKKWPLLHSIHGGPHAAHLDSWHFRWNTQVFAGHGYVVAAVNYHGSSGFGQKWLETITGRYGEKEFADVEAGTDWLLRQGYIDRERLVATGGSYGGFMVAYMNGHTDRYRTFVCHAGLLRLGQHDGDRRLPLLRRRAGRVPLGRPGARDAAVAAPLRQAREDADARDPRRARLPRAGDAGAAVLRHAEGEERAGAARLLPRREPLDPEAAELAALVPRVLRVAGPPRGQTAGRPERRA